MHLLIEVNHFLLRTQKGMLPTMILLAWRVSGGADNGDSCLRCVRHQGGGDLAALLHALVLHRRDVLKPRGGTSQYIGQRLLDDFFPRSPRSWIWTSSFSSLSLSLLSLSDFSGPISVSASNLFSLFHSVPSPILG